jgi:ribonuclease G
MPNNLIIVNRCDDETRIAIVEHGQTRELIVERDSRRGILGNIYKGRVTRVLPGMQSAFVDVGLKRTAFLYVMDIARPHDAEEAVAIEPHDEEEGEREVFVAEPKPVPPIETLIREGQELVVQVSKEPIGTKGARLTSNISLPGRNLVLLPGMEHVGVSRRIAEPEERERLKEIATGLKPETGGLIVRTVGEGREVEVFKEDQQFLTELWKHIQRRESETKAPALIYQDLDLVLKVVRDTLNPSFENVVVDAIEDYERLIEFVDQFMPQYRSMITLHRDTMPVFERYKVELELSRALDRKIWLKSGGYIVIDETEALTAIDVNTGRYVGKTNAEETIVKINLEACKEIAYQLRLRNIGGIIVIDFIDMKVAENRQRVQDTLNEELAGDRSRTHVLPMSELGLIEMTRKRVKKSIRHYLTAPCFYCSGKGYLKSHDVIATEILNRITKDALQAPPNKSKIYVFTHPDVMEYLFDVRATKLELIEAESGKDIVIRPRAEFHLEQFEVYAD